MRSAPRDNPSDTGDVVLERTAAQALWWFLGHWVTVAMTGFLLAAAVITVSAMAAGSAPATPDGMTTPNTATEVASTSAFTETSITVDCPADALLTVTAAGTGQLGLTIDGPANGHSEGSGTVAMTVSGRAGSYTARVTATVRLDRVSWFSTAGACNG